MTIRFLADEDRDIVTELVRREPAIDVLDMHHTGMRGAKDPTLLEFAAQEGRIVISHDRRTMTRYVVARVTEGKSCPGVFIVPQRARIQEVVEALLLIWSASSAEEWRNGVFYIPFR